MRILVIDNSKIIAERLEEIIANEKKIKCIEKAFTYFQAIKLYYELKPDAILLDSELPKNEALRLLKEVKKDNKKAIVIILSVQSDIYFKEKWLSYGADYYFDKYHEFEKIVEVIKTVFEHNYLTE